MPRKISEAFKFGPNDFLEWRLDIKKGEARVKKNLQIRGLLALVYLLLKLQLKSKELE
jgi:hypothetical protein